MAWDPFLLLSVILGVGLLVTSGRLLHLTFRPRESWRVREARRRREASRAALRGRKRTSKHGADVIPLRKKPGVRRPAAHGRPTYGQIHSVVDRRP
jgi:hypothetical protein